MGRVKQSIFMMTSVHPWNDPRIFYKEALSLSKEYSVELHAPGADFINREHEGVTIIGLPQYQRRIFRMLNWLRLLYRAWRSPAAYMHFHDPELILIGLILKIFTKKKVIYDIHENFPASIATKPWIPKWIRGGLARVMDAGEKWAVKYFDAVILAEFSYLERFQHLPVLIQSVVNYPPRKMGREMDEGMVLEDMCKGEKPGMENYGVKFIYAGVISQSRGIKEMIRSFALIKEQGLKFHLFLVGSWISQDLKQEMEELMRDLDLTEHITITGRIDFEQVGILYHQCDVGLALLHPEKNYLTSLATKIFEYMAVGIPILASDFPLWRLLISEHQCGITVDPLNIEEISGKISLLIRKKCLRCRLGNNGWTAFHRYYNWETQEEKLIGLYRKLEGISNENTCDISHVP